MGTNYYLQPNLTDSEMATIEKYNASLPRIHIGKSSGGWVFTFHAIDNDDLRDFTNSSCGQYETISDAESWRGWTSNSRYLIKDEYGQKITYEEFWDKVEGKKGGKNHAELYPDYSFIDDEGNSFSRGEFS